jgi:ABC-type transporter Mla MlaB component
MLRITVHKNRESVTFQLEGKLAGPWVRELEKCWRSTLASQHKPVPRFDLTGVTFIDAAGKAYLADMHRQGAELVAVDCLTKAIVAEIAKTPIPDCGSPKSEGKSQT